MRSVAIIPARGGSKGIKDKNLSSIDGLSLVARSVILAKSVNQISDVYVSTDSTPIAQEAKRFGAQIIERPPELASDVASSEAALLHALGLINPAPDILVFLQATSPFTPGDELSEAINLVSEGKFDVVFSAVESHNFLWSLNDGKAVAVNHDPSVRIRRQDLEPRYAESGGFYVMRAHGFAKAKNRFFGNVGLVEIPVIYGLDIDSEFDLEIARAISPNNKSHQSLFGLIDGIVFDFDGVHTNNFVYVDQTGVETVRVSRSDGMGIELLRDAGIRMTVLSKEKNQVVAARCEKLGLTYVQNCSKKSVEIDRWIKNQDVDRSRVAYLGNDINDIECLQSVGWPIAVSDSHPSIKPFVRQFLKSRGGEGAIRELADLICTNPIKDCVS